MIDKARVRELRDEVGQDDLAEVVALFCEEVEETLSRISGVMPQNLANHLHFLKGSAINIGMSEVGELCVLAEDGIRRNPDTAPDIGQIELAFQRARKELYSEMSA